MEEKMAVTDRMTDEQCEWHADRKRVRQKKKMERYIEKLK